MACTHFILHKSNLLSLGDVSLSAEDKPPPFAVNRPIHSETAATLPIDHSYPDVGEDGDFEEYDVEEHHSWLEGHAAIKFLAAGGIAGAGELYVLVALVQKLTISLSLPNLHCTL